MTYAETVEEMDLETPLPAEPAPVKATVVDAPVFVALVPAVSCAAPTPEVEFRAPAPAASCAAPAPVDEFVAPTPADSCAAPPPVAEYVTQAPFEPDEAPPPVVGRPGSVRRRRVVKAPPVVDSGAVRELNQLVSSPRNQSCLLLSQTFLLLMVTKLLLPYG